MYRIGIIGTGRIAHRFVPEARTINGIEVSAVYNPKLSSAEKFAKELEINFYTDRLDDFCKQVDAVYIASPHETHVDYSREMLKSQKHVLCEKPMAFSGQEVMELKDLAEENNLVIMEAMKTSYCPGFAELLRIVNEGKIGQVVDVEACFTKLVPTDGRELSDLECGGSFLELGSYALLPVIKILGMKPKDIRFWSKKMDNGVDIYTKIHLDYGHSYATGKVGLGAKSEGELIVTGTNGYIRVPAPWWLTKSIEIHYEDPTATQIYTYPFEKDGLRYEIKAFIDRINGEKIDAGVTLEESAWVADLMGNFRKDRKQG